MTIDPNEFLASTIVNVDESERQIVTTHNIIDQTVAETLLTVDMTTGAISGGHLQAILDWFNQPNPTLADATSMLSAFNDSLIGLRDLIKEGVIGSQGETHVSVAIARDIEELLKSIDLVAVDSLGDGKIAWTGPISISADDMLEWHGLAQVNSEISDFIQRLRNSVYIQETTNATTLAKEYKVIPNSGTVTIAPSDPLNRLNGSLQAMVELIYVKGANEFLADNMESLEAALDVTKDSLDSLGVLQNLHNNLVVISPGSFPFDQRKNTYNSTLDGPTPTDVSNFIQGEDARKTAFGPAADDFFGSPPVPELGPGLTDIEALLDQQDDLAEDLGSIYGLNSTFFAAVTGLKDAAEDGAATISEQDLREFEEWRIGIQTYNGIVERVNKQLEPINSILKRAGITTLDIDGVNQSFPITLLLLPSPSFTALDLANGVQKGTSLARKVLSWTDEMADATNTGGDGINQVYLKQMDNAVGTASFGFSEGDFEQAIFSLDIMKNGDPANNIPAHPAAEFYRDMVEQRETIANLITKLRADPNQDDANGLLRTLEDVLDDIDNSGFQTMVGVVGSPDSINLASDSTREAIETFAKTWLIDKNNEIATTGAANIGAIQNNIGFAINAAQSLNDTQKEETRRFLFVFEEFYKSAAAILNKMTQILEKIAQGINR